MRRRICKFSRARVVALAVATGALGSLALASSALATTAAVSPPAGLPLAGTNCVANGNLPAASTTTADLPSGTASPTTLAVTATSVALSAGQIVTVSTPTTGLFYQTFTLAAAAPAGSTSLSVTFTPTPTTQDFPVGSTVTLPGSPSGSLVASGSGKISGRGATLPLYGVINYINQFTQAVCAGPVAADTSTNTYTPPAGFAEPTGDPTDPSSGVDASQGGVPLPTYNQDQMVAYNYPAAQDRSGTGSGQGRVAISCRTDAFSGSDIPYTMADFNNIDGAPGAQAGGLGSCLKASYVSPFQSTANAGDPAGKMMSFPIVGGAIALAVNLPAACANAGGGYNFTTADIAAIWSGTQANWGGLDPTNDPNLTTTCGPGGTNVPVTRVVRQDTSGTSQNFENYLSDASPSTALCATGTFTSISSGTSTATLNTLGDLKGEILQSTAGSNNNIWPTGGSCNALAHAATSGTPALLHTLDGISGGIGYADVTDEVRDPGDAAALVTPAIQNSDATSFQLPTTATGAANCTYSAATLPSPGTGDAVMGIAGQWAIDASTNHTDVAFTAQGEQYPVCALTWEFVFEGDDGNSHTTPSAIQQFLPNPSTLTTAIAAGPVTTLAVAGGTTGALSSGQLVTVASTGAGSTSDTFTVTAAVAKGATSIPVSGTSANAYAAGSQIVVNALKVTAIPAGTPSTGTIILTVGGVRQLATYAGISGNTFTGVTGVVVTGTSGVVAAASTVAMPSGTGGPEPELNPNQRKTLYAYMSYMLSPAAQATDGGAGYAQLPAAWLSPLALAFQTDY